MILIIDNYDSFTYNLVQMVRSQYEPVRVIHNDELTLEEMENLKPQGMIISPGPGTPGDAGICIAAIQHFHQRIPILGVCLGLQAIAKVFGGRVIQAEHIVHGKVDSLRHDGQGLFQGVSNPIDATRYHSLCVDDNHLPKTLMVTSRSETDHTIMGLRHINFPVEGFQFHPESYKTEEGMTMIENFIHNVRGGDYYVQTTT